MVGLVERAAAPCVDRVVAVSAALRPLPWQTLTPRMFVRLVLGALDQHSVAGLLQDLPGTTLGAHDLALPVEDGDERVEALEHYLSPTQWRARVLDQLCAQVLDTLDEWRVQRDGLDADLRALLRGQ